MAVWMMYALVVLVMWGLTGITQKVATNYTSASLTLATYAVAYAPVAAIILWKEPLNWRISATAWFLGILSGMLNGFGSLTLFAACRSGGKASVVTLLAALYPVLTIAMAVPLLHERIQKREIAAIALAIAAAAALSYERKPSQC
jgi:drug/metabolite transporter (DMT)-like permease